jgi:hypothetical protein
MVRWGFGCGVSGLQELVAELVRATGCDLDGPDRLGATAMHAAAANANAKARTRGCHRCCLGHWGC